jgi:adenylate kinase
MVRLIFLGPPNSGKGTYSDRLAKNHDIIKISPGDLFRENIKNNTELGIKVKEYMHSGLLVPDELTISLVKNEIKEIDDFILDGFPRTIRQAEALEKITKVDKVLNFTASQKSLLDRASGRLICPKCNIIYHIRNIPPKIEGKCDVCSSGLIQREDDKIEKAKKRLNIYKKETKPLIDYYKNKNILITINTEKPIEEIIKEIEYQLLLNP